jgi:hypothetical protein
MDVAAMDAGTPTIWTMDATRLQDALQWYAKQGEARQVETVADWTPPGICITGKPLGLMVPHRQPSPAVQRALEGFTPKPVCLKTDPEVQSGQVTSIGTTRVPRS